jgi:hypothetical protein
VNKTYFCNVSENQFFLKNPAQKESQSLFLEDAVFQDVIVEGF